MRTLLACICFITIVAASPSGNQTMDDERCGGGYFYSQELNRCYKRYPDRIDWWAAVAKCRLDDASLLVLETNKEADYIKRIAEQFPVAWIHIGVHDMVSEGTFMSIHGESLNSLEFRTFGKGQPDNYQNAEHCLGLHGGFVLNDFKCEDAKLDCYCEKSAKEEKKASLTNIIILQIPTDFDSSKIIIIPPS